MTFILWRRRAIFVQTRAIFSLSQNKANPTNKKKDSKKNKTRKKGHVKKTGKFFCVYFPPLHGPASRDRQVDTTRILLSRAGPWGWLTRTSCLFPFHVANCLQLDSNRVADVMNRKGKYCCWTREWRTVNKAFSIFFCASSVLFWIRFIGLRCNFLSGE